MNKAKKSFPMINMGTSLLLVVFIVICLIVFATLSLSSSLKDQNYTKQSILKTEHYYKACSKAQRKLQEIDQALIEQKDLSSLKDVNVSLEKQTISFNEKIDQDLLLKVEIQLTNDQNRYKIIKWQEDSSKEWKNETTLPVIGSK